MYSAGLPQNQFKQKVLMDFRGNALLVMATYGAKKWIWGQKRKNLLIYTG